jgi:CMP-N,N'-diacetyllegionaminic acid synthase
MIILVDVDNTICKTEGSDYNKSLPIYKNIRKINKLFEKGNTIIYWTARGTTTNINWFKTTYKQLLLWGCEFHELRMGKPYYDLFIDDKTIDIKKLK